MRNLGPGELLIIFLVLGLIFSSSKLAALGDAIGRRLRGFRRPSPHDPSRAEDLKA